MTEIIGFGLKRHTATAHTAQITASYVDFASGHGSI
jgi:hypothetical protein